MISSIVLWTLCPILTYIAVLIIKETIPFIKFYLNYKHQGLKYHYVPLRGWVGLYSLTEQDELKSMKSILNDQHRGEDMIVMNDFPFPDIVFIINSPELMREIYIKEVEFTRRFDISRASYDDGLLWKYGKEGLKIRTVFNKFFELENLKAIVPDLRKIVDKKIGELRQKIGESEDGVLERFDLGEFYSGMFSEIVPCVLFGEDDIPLVDGKSLTEKIEELFELRFKATLEDKANIFTFGMLLGRKILAPERAIDELKEKIFDAVGKLIDKRMKLGKQDLGVSMIDLMLKHNLEAVDNEKLSKKDIIDNVILLQLAGSDTSKSTIQSTLNYLSLNPDTMSKFEEEILPEFNEKSKNDLDYYITNSKFNSFTDECYRILGPAGLSFMRQTVKSMKLGKYKLKKGAKILFPYHSLQMSEDSFKDSSVFKFDRFTKENFKGVDKGAYLPFGSGRRGCAGKYLGDLLVKMNIEAFMKVFKIVKGYEAKIYMRFTYGVYDCFADLRLRGTG